METGREVELISNRLIFKKLNWNDLDNFIKWWTNDEVMKFYAEETPKLEDAKSQFEQRMKENEKSSHLHLGRYSVHHRSSGVFIGFIMLISLHDGCVAEVGYGIMPEFFGRGYGGEMLNTFIKLAKGISLLRKIVATVHPENTPSIKLLTKYGFSFCGSGVDKEGLICNNYEINLVK